MEQRKISWNNENIVAHVIDLCWSICILSLAYVKSDQHLFAPFVFAFVFVFVQMRMQESIRKKVHVRGDHTPPHTKGPIMSSRRRVTRGPLAKRIFEANLTSSGVDAPHPKNANLYLHFDRPQNLFFSGMRKFLVRPWSHSPSHQRSNNE